MEVYSCLKREPGSVYLGHISPNSGLAAGIFEAMRKFLSDRLNYISFSSIIAVGCDGTAVDTEKHAGTME